MKRRVVLFGAVLAAVHSTLACLWDTDTLAMERSRFPGIAELITGSFARHSKEYHEWRVKQRQQDIVSDQSLPEHFHDLAVSQHKLGDHKAAIATMKRLEKLVPGLYETYSNLGTFYIYTGDLKEALTWIDKALAKNANAHFGREKYQKWLVEWVLERQKQEEESLRGLSGTQEPRGFAKFVATRVLQIADPKMLPENERAAAIRGVTGMMLFADFDNPLLLEALGDLLLTGKIGTNAKQLAGLCYLHAAWKVKDDAEKQRLKGRFVGVGAMASGFDPEKQEELLKKGLANGAAYVETIRQDELKWIAEGKDAAAEFQTKYYVKR